MTDVAKGLKEIMSTQKNFEGGVNKKTSGPVAGKASAQDGEATKPQSNFPNGQKEAAGRTSKGQSPQMNFKNGN